MAIAPILWASHSALVISNLAGDLEAASSGGITGGISGEGAHGDPRRQAWGTPFGNLLRLAHLSLVLGFLHGGQKRGFLR